MTMRVAALNRRTKPSGRRPKATRPDPENGTSVGGFSESFLVQMVRDFFILLVLVMVAELGVRLGLVYYQFDNEERIATRIAAERLTEDVRSLMLNSGGPVAARTIYPVLQRNHESLGLSIAIEPAPVTVSSVQTLFDFTPQGLPADWPESGRFHEHAVPLRAEETCLQCHVDATVGQVLGTIKVRNYLSTHVAHWWDEVRLSGALGLGKTTLHTVVLFFLLKIRMAPLLALRSVVGRLAKAGSDLSHRAPVRSRDEFGDLANDLNLFLDRVAHIVEDLGTVLSKLDALSERMSQTRHRMSEGMKDIRGSLTELADATDAHRLRGALPYGERWLATLSAPLDVLAHAGRSHRLDRDLMARIEATQIDLDRLKAAMAQAEDNNRPITPGLMDLAARLETISRTAAELEILEERMHGIAEMGRTLVRRLSGQAHDEPPR